MTAYDTDGGTKAGAIARWRGPLLAGAAAMGVALAAGAAQPAPVAGEYAWQWPLVAEGQNAAWQFELTPAIYAVLVDDGLHDFQVLNGQGQPVPVARLTLDPAARPGVTQARLPVFALPRAAADGSGDAVSLRLERDPDGRLRMLQAQTAAAAPQALIDYVMDADVSRDPKRPSSVDRLSLDWPARGDVNARFAVDGSEDLERWEPLVEAAAIVSMRRDGALLQRRDIALPVTTLRYLRLRQLEGDALEGLQISARRTRAGAPPPPWRRLRAAFVEAGRDEVGKDHVYRYRLPAKLPVGRVNAALGADNATAEVIVDARSGEAWIPMMRMLLYRLQQGGLRVDSEDEVLTAPFAAREWRLRSPVALNPAPVVEVAYLPDRFVFLAQGGGPYRLVAGSRDARRNPMPVEQALAPLRARLGRDWSPPVATFGPRATAAGEAAYAERPEPVDWRGWILWALLVAGAALIAGFALSLLRNRPADRD